MKKYYKFGLIGILMLTFIAIISSIPNITGSPCIQKNKIQTNFQLQESPLEGTLQHFIATN